MVRFENTGLFAFSPVLKDMFISLKHWHSSSWMPMLAQRALFELIDGGITGLDTLRTAIGILQALWDL